MDFLQAWEAAAQRARAPLAPHVVEAARRSWFDTIAATAAGVRENCTQAARRSAGSARPAPADAALVFGAASHALDYDDVSMLATCHPSAPPVAALLAMLPLHRPGLSYGEVLAAYVLGTETTLRLGEWLGFRHYALGFHATATLGVVGVAAAAAHALQLPGKQAHAALAIAASNAGGLRANFGSDTKPLHVGFAAAAGLRSALLAQAGADASDDVWGPTGYPLALRGGELPGELTWGGDGEWAIARPGFEHKRFPSCYMTHRLVAGVLAIRARHEPGPVDIEIEMPRNGTAPLKHPRPETGLQAKFSGEYCAAAAWLDGRIDLGSFAQGAVQREAVRTQMRRVRLHERGTPGESLDTAPVRVTVRSQGWSEAITVDWAPGSPADPMTREQLLAKWRDCAAHAGLQDAQSSALALLDAPLATAATRVLEPLHGMLLAAIERPEDEQ